VQARHETMLSPVIGCKADRVPYGTLPVSPPGLHQNPTPPIPAVPWCIMTRWGSSGLELLDLGWADSFAVGVICASCGYVHEVVVDAVALWDRDGGYPAP